jgi:Flp pilus assembly protein TadB
MTFTLTLAVELALSVLLAATLIYCALLEKRLKAVRQGQQQMKSTIDSLNASLATAGASLRALQAAAGTIGETLDRKLSLARSTIDELSLVTASGERIASRMERSVDTKPAQRAANPNLPSGSVMERLKVAR